MALFINRKLICDLSFSIFIIEISFFWSKGSIYLSIKAICNKNEGYNQRIDNVNKKKSKD